MAGPFAVALRKNLRKLVGDQDYERILAALSLDQRDELLSATSLGWVRLSMVDAVVEAAADATGRDAVEINASITRMNVEHTILGVWRLLLKAATDRMIIQRAPALYTRAYNRGVVTSQWLGRGHATVTVTDWPEIPRNALAGGAVGLETLLGHAGRTEVRIEAERTAEGAILHVQWA